MPTLTWVSENIKLSTSDTGLKFIAGHHQFRYAIFPHIGPLDHRTVRAGYNFNNPLKLLHHPAPDKIKLLLSSITIDGAPNLVVDCIKRGEDDEDVSLSDRPKRKARSIIVRVFDSLGGKSKGFLRWGDIPVKKVWKTNLLEDDLDDLKMEGSRDGIEIELRAFEIVTYRLQL